MVMAALPRLREASAGRRGLAALSFGPFASFPTLCTRMRTAALLYVCWPCVVVRAGALCWLANWRFVGTRIAAIWGWRVWLPYSFCCSASRCISSKPHMHVVCPVRFLCKLLLMHVHVREICGWPDGVMPHASLHMLPGTRTALRKRYGNTAGARAPSAHRRQLRYPRSQCSAPPQLT